MKSLSLPTASAHWGWDEHRYFGYRVFGELAGRESLTSLTALSVLGRKLPPEACAVLDDAAVCLTLADPRIWPLKLTRVVAAYGGTLAAAAAGLLIEEGARIGPWACTKAAELLSQVQRELGGAEPTEAAVGEIMGRYLTQHRFVWGFGTPFREKDERLVAFYACLERRQRCHLPYLRTFNAIAKVVRKSCRVEPNMGIAVAAALLDLGLDVSEVGPLATALVQHMFFAHAVEGARHAPDALQLLPERTIRYVGRDSRPSARALAYVCHEPLPKPLHSCRAG